MAPVRTANSRPSSGVTFEPPPSPSSFSRVVKPGTAMTRTGNGNSHSLSADNKPEGMQTLKSRLQFTKRLPICRIVQEDQGLMARHFWAERSITVVVAQGSVTTARHTQHGLDRRLIGQKSKLPLLLAVVGGIVGRLWLAWKKVLDGLLAPRRRNAGANMINLLCFNKSRLSR
jgi:hypothetical protein